jgi:branched-chain amino acid transport system permease protein
MKEILEYSFLPLSLFGLAAINVFGLQLIIGGAGLLSLGHAAFFAIGGYLSAMLSAWAFPALGISQWPEIIQLFLCVVGAFIGAGICGFLVSLPCLKLEGDYLAMATLGFSELISTLLKNSESLGGTRGFKDIPALKSLPLIFITACAVFFGIQKLYKSPFGRSLFATRDDEIAARSLGINTIQTKTIAFSLGSALAGVAGAFYAHLLSFISPLACDFSVSVELVLAVVLGGMYKVSGAVIGAFVLFILPEVLRFMPNAISQNRMLVFAGIVTLLMIFRPDGLASLIEKLPKYFSKNRKFKLS